MMTFDEDAYKLVDYKKVYSKANEILATSSAIEDFPFKAKSLIYEQSDIKLCSYSKAKVQFEIDINTFGSESAVIQEYDGRFIIFYNQDEPSYRVRFSIVHEFGHYIFGHKMNLKETDILYHKQELEANCFAAQVLMPEQILRECEKRGRKIMVRFIMDSFGVSDDAAKKRKQTLANTNAEWKSREESLYDDIILNKYMHKVNQIAPIKNDYYDFEEDYYRQSERETWLDNRSRW